MKLSPMSKLSCAPKIWLIIHDSYAIKAQVKRVSETTRIGVVATIGSCFKLVSILSYVNVP